MYGCIRGGGRIPHFCIQGCVDKYAYVVVTQTCTWAIICQQMFSYRWLEISVCVCLCALNCLFCLCSQLYLFAYHRMQLECCISLLSVMSVLQWVTRGSSKWPNQFVLSYSQVQLQRALRCMCVFLRAGLGAYSLDMPLPEGLTGFNQCVSCLSCVSSSSEDSWPQCLVGWRKPTETNSGEALRQELNRCSRGEDCEVKPNCQSKPFWLSPDKRFKSLHRIEAFRRGNSACLCLQWKEKTKTNPC